MKEGAYWQSKKERSAEKGAGMGEVPRKKAQERADNHVPFGLTKLPYPWPIEGIGA